MMHVLPEHRRKRFGTYILQSLIHQYVNKYTFHQDHQIPYTYIISDNIASQLLFSQQDVGFQYLQNVLWCNLTITV